jgi:hypothetical protein
VIGVDQTGVEQKIRQHLPGYMAMGETGMYEHSEHVDHMQGPRNTLPMMAGKGPFGPIGMGGMFTLLKVREPGSEDAAWYPNPPGTVASPVAEPPGDARPPTDQPARAYACPMHPAVTRSGPGDCPTCGTPLQPK